MKGNKDLMELGKEKLEQMKTVFEELEVQLALGKAEAKELFEREKKNMNEFINEQKLRFKKEEEIAEEHWDNLREKFETLEANLAEETPEGKEAFDAVKEKTLRSIYELESAMKEAYGEIGGKMREQLDQFKAKLDSYRIQLALSEFGSEDEGNVRRDELRQKVEEIREKMSKEEKDASKLDDFVNEMSASFDHMKRAFSDLFA